MAYATKEEVRRILRRTSSSVDGNASSIPDETIIDQIESAEAKIDATLASQYVTPFDPVPKLINWICKAIAGYWAELTHRETRSMEDEFNPQYLRYVEAQSMLDKLATGTLVIPPEGETPEPGVGNRVVSEHNRDSLICESDFDIDRSCSSPGYTTSEQWAIH